VICQSCGRLVERSASDVRIECGRCFLIRIGSVRIHYHPSATPGRASRTGGLIDPAASRRHEARMEDYRRLKAEGQQPKTTQRKDLDAAKRASDETGEPFQAGRFARVKATEAI
jgi:predicted  nucleic acid-binding Zn-ribbon protein